MNMNHFEVKLFATVGNIENIPLLSPLLTARTRLCVCVCGKDRLDHVS